MLKKSILKYLITSAIIWTVIILVLTSIDIIQIKENESEFIRQEAISNFNKDAATRYWASKHGGVYVPITKETQPNQFLSHIEERDIATPLGKKLTLMNPAYMLREQMEDFYLLYGIKGHITSLNYYRPETAPDRWEIQALKAFNDGVKEVSSYNKVDGKEYFRLMKPLIADKGCLKCHSKQGYKVGDIRGGVSISVPTENYKKISTSEIETHSFTNIFIWILGLLFLYIFGKKLRQKENERFIAKQELENYSKSLENEIEIRTSEILTANKKLHDKIKEKTNLEKILERTNKIINNSQAVAFVWKNQPAWPVEYVTENVEQMLGYSVEDFTSGKVKYSQIIHKSDIARVSEEVKLSSESKTNIGFIHKNYRLISKSGKTIWIEDRTSIKRDENGNVILFEGIIIDVSKRQKIEEENLFKTEFERKIATISTYFVNLKLKDINRALSFTAQSFGRFLQADAAYVVLLNPDNEFEIKQEFTQERKDSKSSKSENFSITTYNWLHFSLLKGKPILVQYVEQLGSVANNEKILMNNLGIKSFAAIPIVVAGEFYGFIRFDSKGINNSISKNNSSLFQLLTEVISNLYSRYLNEIELVEISDTNRSLIQAVEQSADSVVITDLDGNIQYVNPKFIELTGYTQEEAIGKNPRILKSGNTSAAEYETLWKTITSGKPWKGQFKNINKDGNIFWEQATISPIKNEKNILTHFLAIKKDITEKILLENQRSLSQKMESIGQLAAGIAHEINTPMQYVGDNANFLADAYTSMTQVFNDFTTFLEDGNIHTQIEIHDFYKDKMAEMDLEFIFEEVPEALDQTKTGIERVTKIVRAMKDFAHPGSKEKAYYNLNKGLQNTITISKNEWKYIAEIDKNLDDNLTEVLCLQDELNQVFLNMIVNSAHAIDEKNKKNEVEELGTITITTIKKDNSAIVKIADTGNGIKQENIDRVFDPFFTTKEVGKGTGQGLAIVHDIIVTKHGGTISVESEIGVGTTFTIELPINGNEDII